MASEQGLPEARTGASAPAREAPAGSGAPSAGAGAGSAQERAGDGTAVHRLAALLTAAGTSAPTPLELAEVLWLAGQSADGEQPAPEAAPTPPARTDGDRAPDAPSAPTARTRHGEGPVALPAATGPTPPAAGPGRVALHLPAPAPPAESPSPSPGRPGGGGTSLLAPAPPMLARPLDLQRALRPLKRTVPSARARLLDERATADRIARLGAHPDVWLPVLRPAHDRWLRLNLVHDTGPTMPVWRPLVREMHTALAQSGVFHTVTLHPADADGRTRYVPGPADRRTVTLVISDCTGPQWRPGPAGDRWYSTLRRWAARMPLAVVQPLPERLWPTTALPAEPGVLSSPSPAAPLTDLAFAPYDPDAAPRPAGAVALPVLEPDARWVTHWAALLARSGGGRAPGAAAWLPPRPGPPPPADAGADPAALPARDLVLRFRATASPEAFRLAGHLALAVPSVPVMRLVQRAVERDPRPQHLAEVILSGMLTAVPGPPGSYAFRPGVRDLLLRTLPRTVRGRTRELLAAVGGSIDDRAGLATGEFRAETGREDGPGSGPAFATVSEETVRRLGGGGEETRPNGPASPEGDGDAAPLPHATLLFETDTDLGTRPEARIGLEYAVHQVLDRGDLTPQQYEVRVRPDGYRVRVAPDAFLLPVLAAALRWLPGRLADPAGAPRLRVTFRPGGAGAAGPVALPETTAPVLVVVPPSLYEGFADSSAAAGPHRFHPLYGDAPDSPPLAWYCPLPAPRAEDERRDLVRGPFLTRDLRELGIPAPGRTAVVHTRPDGPLTLLDPAEPYGGRPPRTVTYYQVDLTPHRAVHRVPLPSSGKGDFTAHVELTWRVVDPVAFVRSGADQVSERLLAHLTRAASRITRRHSPRRAAGAQRAVATQLGRWPVPGLAVACTVRLAPEWAPVTTGDETGERPLTPAGLLAGAETVLVGFDGPLTRLFTATTARTAALDLLALAAEHRDPGDAFTGRPLAVAAARESVVHPLDVLRVFARDAVGPLLRDRLDALELAAVPNAPTTHNSVALVRALYAAGRRVAVVTDVCEEAVHRYLQPYRLPLAGVHGRDGDLTLLTPHPDCLLRALRSPDAPAATGVLIGSSVAELTAAQQIGLRFIGLARNPTVEQDLRAAGCQVTVRSLAPVLEAARAL
ncbi:SAV_2336 N-terminal domain-related protein [Streptomyces sp. NPDC017936]|uniref:SAV_2336 N-terminal domain-related protein n=1 Tax=Streptomyces sp. NPDC017936 TaxID=3365016 RepID=UPI0037B9C2B4